MTEHKIAKELQKITAKINSYSSLQSFVDKLAEFWIEHKYIKITVHNMRSLSQNALKSVWYKDIADYYGDRTAKDVERECKFKYGLLILRRKEVNNWLYSRSIDKLRYDKQLILIDSFAVTSAMSTAELKEYMNMMQVDYPFLECKKNKSMGAQ